MGPGVRCHANEAAGRRQKVHQRERRDRGRAGRWVPEGERRSLDDVSAGEAAIVKLNGERTAVFRDERGQLHAVSAVCTHMGCVLGWNRSTGLGTARATAPASLDGAVLHGPATSGLERIPVLTEQEAGSDAAPAPSLPCGQTDLRTPKRIS